MFHHVEESTLQRCQFQISVESVKPFAFTKQFCILQLPISYCTVRPLFKKFTQHCETYETTNSCVKKLHNLCKILHNLCKIVHKLCYFFTQLLVGSYVHSVVYSFKQRSNSVCKLNF